MSVFDRPPEGEPLDDEHLIDGPWWKDPWLRDRRVWAVAFLLGLAAAGHVWFWYSPRYRPALPADGTAAALLRHETLPLSVWIPYPHQNMALMERSLGVELETLRGALEAAELPNPSVPRFGSMAVPPSRAVAVATDLDGERFVVAAEIYPSVAAFSKLAGSLAGNPWLGGGDVVRGERRLEVEWIGNTWTVKTRGTPGLPDSEELGKAGQALDGAAAFVGRPALLVAQATEARAPLPTGRYYLFGDRTGIDFVSQDATEPPADWGQDLARADALLLAASGADTPLGAGGQAMVLVGQDPDALAELPRGAVLHRIGVERWELPSETVLRMAGRRAKTESTDWLDLAFTDEAGAAAGKTLAPRVADLLISRHHGGPVFGLWLEIGPAAAEISRLRRGLERAPLLPPKLKARWRGAETFLTGLSGPWRRLSLTVHDSPPALWLRVEAQVTAPSADPSEASGQP